MHWLDRRGLEHVGVIDQLPAVRHPPLVLSQAHEVRWLELPADLVVPQLADVLDLQATLPARIVVTQPRGVCHSKHTRQVHRGLPFGLVLPSLGPEIHDLFQVRTPE